MARRNSTYGDAIRISAAQAKRLAVLQRSSNTDAKTARRARILELLGEGWRQCEIEAATGAGIATIGRVRRRFLEHGFDAAVFGYAPPGAPKLLDESDETKIVALACTDPPVGRSRWTTELLAEEAVKRGFVERVGRETVRIVLKHHGLKPCLDEKPVCLHAEKRRSLLAHDGSRRRDYEYRRQGTANLFVGVEPKAGVHTIKATKTRDRFQFARFLRDVERKYSRAKTIHLVMDNLSTHSKKGLIDALGKKRPTHCGLDSKSTSHRSMEAGSTKPRSKSAL